MDARGLANYLANNPDIKGIGPAKARIIAERFGSDFERSLIDEPEKVAEAAKVPLPVIESLRVHWLETSHINQAMTALAAYGLTHHQVTKLVKKLGNNAVGIIEHDPYVIVGEIDGFGFKRIDKIARQVGIAKDNPNRVRAGLQFCIEDALDQGDCWVEYEDLLNRANKLLVMDTLDSREQIERYLDELIDKKALTCYAADSRFLVAKPEIRQMEEDLARVFARGKDMNPHFRDLPDIDSMIRRISPRLNHRQHEAAMMVCKHAISLITGGAGSGKTFTIDAITRLCESRKLKAVLCAPTGKAAKRMEESTGQSASTIHRLLGFDGKTYSRNAENPISADILIVDEASMIDVSLAWRLFQAINLERTAVVLVGDHNQLPPVGPGNILRDLIESKAIPTTILEDVVRQAGVLKENSIAILKGEVRKTCRVEDGLRGPWYVANQHTEAERVQQFILDIFDQVLSEKLGFDLLRDVQVLTPTHKGPLGTAELNIRLQSLIQKKLWDYDVLPVQLGRRPKLLVGDKVIQTRNNYDLEVMNGSMGYVRDLGADGSLTVDFDDKMVFIEPGSPHRSDLQLAYALTIHKCISEDTLIPTNRGLLPIGELASGVPEKTSLPHEITIAARDGIESTESIYNGGFKPVIQLRTRAGFELSGSYEHPVLTADENGFCWKLMPEVVEGDVLVLRRDTVSVQRNFDYIKMPMVGREVTIDEEAAWIMGVMVGDGNYSDHEDYRVEVTKGSHDLMLRYIAGVQKVLGVRTTVRQVAQGSRFTAYFHNKAARDLLYRCGLDYCTAPDKSVPPVILRSSPNVQAAFLRGLFDTDGGVTGLIVLATASERVAREVHLLLLHHGIVSKRYKMRDAIPEKDWSEAWRVEIMGASNFHLFRSRVGFSEEIKEFALEVACETSNAEAIKSNWGGIPFGRKLIREFREELRRRGGRNYPEARDIGRLLARIICGAAKLNHLHVEHINRHVSDIAETGKAGMELDRLFREGFFFDPVVEIGSGNRHVYDVSVPGSHSFVGNGIVNHNSQGSEFPCSIVIAHKSHSFMHHRNLLYTGVTRAKKTAIIVGDHWGITNCAKRVQVDARKTFLSLLLAGGV